MISSGVRTVRLRASSRLIRLLRVSPTLQLATLAHRAHTSRNTARDPVALCHLKVSGTGGSFAIEHHSLIRGQDPAPVDSPSGKRKQALAGLRCPSPTSRCLAAQEDMAVVHPLPNSSSNSSSGGSSPTRAPSIRTGLVVTKDRASSSSGTTLSFLVCALFNVHDIHALLSRSWRSWIARLSLSLCPTSSVLFLPFIMSLGHLHFLLCSISISSKK
jgi:hypothetical protein